MRLSQFAVVTAAALTLGGSLAAQDVSEADGAEVREPRVLGRRPAENDAVDRPVTPLSCLDQEECLDASLLDREPAPLSEGFVSPVREPLPPLPPIVEIDPATGQTIRRTPRVRAGRGFPVAEGTTPWMAQIQRPVRVAQLTQRSLDWEDRQFCGGAFIAPGWVLTAAHCLVDAGGVSIKTLGYRIRLGVSNIERGETGATYRIVDVFKPPEYNPSTYYGDIALVRFASDAQTGSGRIRASHIRLDGAPQTGRQFGGTEAWFYGWGRTERNRPSGPLQYGPIPLQTDQQCRNSALALCGQGFGVANSVACKGDSGGPLVWRGAVKGLLIGVVSHNPERVGCGLQQKPGVYTRVAFFRKWIVGLTGPLP